MRLEPAEGQVWDVCTLESEAGKGLLWPDLVCVWLTFSHSAFSADPVWGSLSSELGTGFAL